MLFGLFLTLGVAVLSVALRSYQTSFAQKAGAIGILISTFLAVYFVSDSWGLGLLAALAWLFLPWLEILTRIRALRLPKEKALRPKSPPSEEVFPTLEEITREIRERRLRAHQRCGLGLGRLPPVLPALLQGRRSRAGDHLPERAERSFVLLPAHFLARE